MKKDAYYFPHFCNARHDRKIKRLQKDLGLEGYGIFFMILEVLREQTDFKYPYQDLDLLADEFNTSTAKLEAVINAYDLFEIDSQHNFFSPKLVFYLQPYLEKSERAKRANEIRWEKQKQLMNTNQNSKAIQKESIWIPSQNPSKVKESKVKESKEEERKETISAAAASPESFYQNNFGLLTPMIAQEISQWLEDGIEEELMLHLMKEAVSNNARTWRYVNAAIKNQHQKNVFTLQQYLSAEEERRRQRQPKQKEVVEFNFDEVWDRLEAQKNGQETIE